MSLPDSQLLPPLPVVALPGRRMAQLQAEKREMLPSWTDTPPADDLGFGVNESLGEDAHSATYELGAHVNSLPQFPHLQHGASNHQEWGGQHFEGMTGYGAGGRQGMQTPCPILKASQ